MSDTKFTPGTWAAELGEVHEVRDADGGRICILTQLRGRHGLGGRRPDHESPANARLMAAAPEMFEALKNAQRLLSKVVTVFFNDKIQDHIPFGLTDEVKAAFSEDALGIDAALAKAVNHD